jgi:hypothetical protein
MPLPLLTPTKGLQLNEAHQRGLGPGLAQKLGHIRGQEVAVHPRRPFGEVHVLVPGWSLKNGKIVISKKFMQNNIQTIRSTADQISAIGLSVRHCLMLAPFWQPNSRANTSVSLTDRSLRAQEAKGDPLIWMARENKSAQRMENQQ